MLKKVGIIADDFTGANDTGVQLAKKGFRSSVMVRLGQNEMDGSRDVLIIDTNSRSLPEKAAYEAVDQAASFFLENRFDIIYKKVDSTLRGNIGAELAAVERVVQPDLVVIAPAFPKMGRTTRDGNHFVEGKLVSTTEFGKDPKTPVSESDIVKLIERHSEHHVVNIRQDRLNDEGFESFIEEQLNQKARSFVCDAEDEADLERIAEKFAQLPYKVLWVGSAGLIEYLPEKLSMESESGEKAAKLLKAGQTLTVSGSLSEKTKRQLQELATLNHVQMIEVDPVDILEGTLDYQHHLSEFDLSMDLVVYVDNNEQNRLAALQTAERLGMTKEETGSQISEGLGMIAKYILNTVPIEGMILTGGDTAKDVCLAIDVAEMELIDEIEAGVPMGRVDFNGKRLLTVTKAGGFGKENTLKHALHHMKGMTQAYDSNE